MNLSSANFFGHLFISSDSVDVMAFCFADGKAHNIVRSFDTSLKLDKKCLAAFSAMLDDKLSGEVFITFHDNMPNNEASLEATQAKIWIIKSVEFLRDALWIEQHKAEDIDMDEDKRIEMASSLARPFLSFMV